MILFVTFEISQKNISKMNNLKLVTIIIVSLTLSSLIYKNTYLEKTKDNPPSQLDFSCVNSSEIKTFGNTGSSEGGRVLLSTSTGFIIGGTKDDSTLIINLDNDANLIWARTFKFSTLQNEGPIDMILDSDNNLVGVGHGTGSGTRQNFAFKYNISNHTVIWANRLDLPSTSGWRKVLENGTGGNYFVLGNTGTNSSPGNGCDALFMEIERTTGAKLFEINNSLGSCETFTHSLIHNNAVYSTGIVNYTGSFAGIRPTLTKLDFQGQVLWSRAYLQNGSNTGRIYGSNLLIENDSILVVGRGDLNGTSGTSVNIYLFKTDINGNAQWSKEFNVPGAISEKPSEIVSISDGFIIKGFYTTSSTLNHTFLMKVNKQGTLIWSKTFSNVRGTDYVNDLVVKGNAAHFVGYHNVSNSNDDVLFATIDLQGNIPQNCISSDLSILENNIPNPIDDFVTLSEFSLTFNINSITVNSNVTTLAETLLCSAQPKPDLTPVLAVLPSTISGNSAINIVIEVSEVNNVDTDGSIIAVRMPSDSRLLFVWDIGLTQVGNIPVNNSVWNYLGDNGVFHNWEYNGPGLIMNAGSNSSIGIRGFYDPQSTDGQTTVSSTIVPFSGGECNFTNNTDAESLIYFD